MSDDYSGTEDIEYKKGPLENFFGLFNRKVEPEDNLESELEKIEQNHPKHIGKMENYLIDGTRVYLRFRREKLNEIEDAKSKWYELKKGLEEVINTGREIIEKELEILEYVSSSLEEGVPDNNIVEELIERGNTVSYIQTKTEGMLVNIDWSNYEN